MSDELLFVVTTPIGLRVRVTRERWQLIVTAKHPVMAGCEDGVKAALEAPDEVRESSSDRTVFMFYKAERVKRWVCAVAKETETDGFLVTAYPTDAIKEGVRIWPK